MLIKISASSVISNVKYVSFVIGLGKLKTLNKFNSFPLKGFKNNVFELELFALSQHDISALRGNINSLKFIFIVPFVISF